MFIIYSFNILRVGRYGMNRLRLVFNQQPEPFGITIWILKCDSLLINIKIVINVEKYKIIATFVKGELEGQCW